MTRSCTLPLLGFFAVLALSACGSKAVQAMTGNDWLERCRAEDELARGQCELYLEAILDAGAAESAYLRSGCSTSKCRIQDDSVVRGSLTGVEWCLPKGTSSSTATAQAADWLAGDLIARNRLAPEALAAALTALWPCGK